MIKRFLITIDTESDNQWLENSKLTTENALYIPRFQRLCEKYKFKPVYLTDYSMANSEYFIEFAKESLKKNTCEIGAHPHAWDIPPFHEYDNCINGKPYLIEYPEKIMREKIKILTNLLEDRFERKILSHRSGRWAINEKYLSILGELGYKIDCSVTPGVNWNKQKGQSMGGADYSEYICEPSIIQKEYNIMEIPMTIRNLRGMTLGVNRDIQGIIKSGINLVVGKKVWLRPSVNSEKEIFKLLDVLELENTNYIEFMMHSSEFMPGGSPYFKSDYDIECLYENLERLFEKISLKYEGKTLKEYYEEATHEI